MAEIIHLPAVAQPSNRERLEEILRMKRKYVVSPVVEMKTFRQLRSMEKLLRLKIKQDETPNPEAPKPRGRGPGSPRGGKIIA